MRSSSRMTVGIEANDVRSQLRAHFGHQEFRPGQQQMVAAVLSGRDVLAVMPTGRESRSAISCRR